MSKSYKIIADDGNGDKVEVEMNRGELCHLIGDTFKMGVIASQKIEGEPTNDSDFDLLKVKNLPEPLLVTT